MSLWFTMWIKVGWRKFVNISGPGFIGVQNNAFEGELTGAQLERIKAGLSDLIDQDYDSVYIYRLPDKKYVQKEVLGLKKALTEILLE